MDAEVVVVGGGPAGSATAALLARAGRDVLLVDRARFPRDKACAEYLSPATADALDRIGALAAVEATGPARPYGMRLSVGVHGAALIAYPCGAGRRRALCLSRRVLDHVLLRHAARSGARIVEGWQVHDVSVGRDRAAVAGRPTGAPSSRREVFTARAVVGADGSRSRVACALGLDRPVPWPRRAGAVAHSRGVPDAERLLERGEILIGRGAYCGLAPQPDGSVNVALVADMARAAGRRGPAGGRSPLRPLPIGSIGAPESASDAWLARIPGAAARLRGAERVGPLRGVAPLARRVTRLAGDGFLLAGDAAGFLDPLTGEGVYRALRGAEIAAEALDDALRRCDSGAARGDALAPYAAERRREFAAKEALCWLIQGFLAWPPLLAYALRRLASRPATGDVLGPVLGDYRPAADALNPLFLWSLLRP
jgi:flavin-dependent dehydrogenase